VKVIEGEPLNLRKAADIAIHSNNGWNETRMIFA